MTKRIALAALLAGGLAACARQGPSAPGGSVVGGGLGATLVGGGVPRGVPRGRRPRGGGKPPRGARA